MIQCISLVCLVLTNAAGSGPLTATLQWKFEKGQTFYLEEKSESKGTVDYGNGKEAVHFTTSRLWHFLVKDITLKGIVLEARVLSWILRDRLNDPQRNLVRVKEKAAKDIVFFVHLTPGGIFEKMEGFDAFMAKWAALRGHAVRQTRRETEEDFLEALPLAFRCLPATPAMIGGTWTHNWDVFQSFLGNVRLALTFTYLETAKNFAHCGIKAAMAIQPYVLDDGASVQVWQLHAKTTKGEGEVVFDTARKRLVSFRLTAPLVGAVTMEMDRVEAVRWPVDQVRQWTILLHEKMPAGKGP